jgi:hypothetical protein
VENSANILFAVSDIDELLRVAIAEKRLVTFVLDGYRRVAEPHDFGVIDGVRRLFFFQVGGASHSGRPLGWRWAIVDKMSELRLLDDHFPGSRSVPSGRHHRWEILFASVSRRS